MAVNKKLLYFLYMRKMADKKRKQTLYTKAVAYIIVSIVFAIIIVILAGLLKGVINFVF